MNPVQAVRSCLRQYAVFSGRAPRSEYWWWILSVGVVNVVLGIGFSEEISGTPADPAAVGESALNIPSVVFLVATFLPTLAVTVRRLHDGDWTGWWAASVALVNAFWVYGAWVGPYGFGVALGGSTLVLLLFLVASVGWLLVFIRMFVSGSQGTNRFGPRPLRAGVSDAPDAQ